jgi:hypothetical protein
MQWLRQSGEQNDMNSIIFLFVIDLGDVASEKV